jgi:hypothetical protein
MSRNKPKDIKEEEESDKKKAIDSVAFATAFLKSKENKDFHFNFAETADDYLVSSGSIILDNKIGGGFRAGLLRFVGVTEGGKSSEALLVLHNMINSVANSKALYVKAEGRLSPEVQARSGVKFVTDPEEWVVGTCLILECNVFDTVFDFIRGMLKHNPNKEKYCIVIDSMDGLISKGDLEKTTGEANKVAAGALLTSDFLKRVSLGMSKFGHICILTAQQRSKVSIDPYAKQDTNNTTGSSGGNASLHYPDWILEFQRVFKGDKIMDDPKAPAGPDNKVYGHMAKILICKSTNETTGDVVKYPIRYGRKGGNSIWVEREIVDMLLMWEFINKKSSWFSFDEEVNTFLNEKGISINQPIQGMKSVYELLENDSELTNALRQFVIKNCPIQ